MKERLHSLNYNSKLTALAELFQKLLQAKKWFYLPEKRRTTALQEQPVVGNLVTESSPTQTYHVNAITNRGETPIPTCQANIRMLDYKYFQRAFDTITDDSCRLFELRPDLVNGRFAWNTTDGGNIYWNGTVWMLNKCHEQLDFNICHIISISAEDVECPFDISLFQSVSTRSTVKTEIFYLPLNKAESDEYSGWSSWTGCSYLGFKLQF